MKRERDGHVITDIDQLVLPQELKDTLVKNGYLSIQSLAAVSADDLQGVTGMSTDEADVVCRATEAFLRVQMPLPTL